MPDVEPAQASLLQVFQDFGMVALDPAVRHPQHSASSFVSLDVMHVWNMRMRMPQPGGNFGQGGQRGRGGFQGGPGGQGGPPNGRPGNPPRNGGQNGPPPDDGDGPPPPPAG